MADSSKLAFVDILTHSRDILCQSWCCVSRNIRNSLMPPPSKRLRKSRSAVAIQKRNERKANNIIEEFELFKELASGLLNPRGKTRSFEENKLLLLALLSELRRQLDATDGTAKSISAISWTPIEC